jgi:transposase
MYYIGLDVHKKTISYSIKDVAGQVFGEGKIDATRKSQDAWIQRLPSPRTMALEATMFTGWIYDHLQPHAAAVKVSHPLMLRAIAAAKKKNERIDASKIADCLRCDFLPECYMAATAIRERRTTLRFGNLTMRQGVQMKNRMSSLLMETGVEYDKQRLHQTGYFGQMLKTNAEVSHSIRPLLKQGREHIERIQKVDRALLQSLERDPMLRERVRRLRTIPGVGLITALTWVLEIGDSSRFSSIGKAVSYCGLCGAEDSSADKVKRTPISKQRNQYLQHVLVEAAKLAPRYNEGLARVHAKELERGNRNRATLAVARRLVAYMLAVERKQKDFVPEKVEKLAA